MSAAGGRVIARHVRRASGRPCRRSRAPPSGRSHSHSRAHRLDVAEHHRDAVRARPRRSRRRRVDLLPVSAAGREAAESRHVSEAGRGDRSRGCKPDLVLRPGRVRTRPRRSCDARASRPRWSISGSLAERVLDDSSRSARRPVCPTRPIGSSAELNASARSRQGRRRRPGAAKVLIIVGRQTGTLDRHHRGRARLVPERHRRDRRRRQRAGGDRRLRVPAHLDGDGHQPRAGRHHRRRRDGRVAGRFRPSAARSPKACGSGRRWSRRCATGGVHASHDEAFVVPGPRDRRRGARRWRAWFHGVDACK